MSLMFNSYRSKLVSLEQAAKLIQSNWRVYVSGNAATPLPMLQSLAAHAPALRGVELVHVLQFGQDHFAAPELANHIRQRSLFVGPADRASVACGRADYLPISLHDIPKLFSGKILPLDAAIVQTSPPDQHGFLSLGVEVLASPAAIAAASTIIAVINPRMPRTFGDGFVHLSKVHACVESEFDLPELPHPALTEVEARIGQHVAALVEDGATLQLGIGAIPNAVLANLRDRHDLGVHSEMISEGLLDLIECGALTGARKTLQPGKIVGTFALGGAVLYRALHDNPLFELHRVDYVNNPAVIAQQHRMTSINSAIEIDLTGQVCSDSIGTRIYSGFGGQLDFVRGATASSSGRSIIALPSLAKQNSRIVPMLQPGAGVVTTRADVNFVVTEYGTADLFGRSLRERARALINIAHPNFRAELEQAAWQRGLLAK